MKTLINKINQLRQLKEEASDKYYFIIDKYDDMLCDDLITESEYIEAEKQAEAQTNYNLYCNQLFLAEKELLNRYKQGLKSNGLYSNDMKELFTEASKRITIHDKLVNKITSIEGGK